MSLKYSNIFTMLKNNDFYTILLLKEWEYGSNLGSFEFVILYLDCYMVCLVYIYYFELLYPMVINSWDKDGSKILVLKKIDRMEITKN